MLDREHKAELNRLFIKLSNILDGLDDIPVDPRAFELIEVAASLIHDQIEHDIVYEIIDEDEFEAITPEDFNINPNQEYETEGFKFLQPEIDIPTVEDLQKQWDLPFPPTSLNEG